MLTCLICGKCSRPGAASCAGCGADEKSLRPVVLSIASEDGSECYRVKLQDLPFAADRAWGRVHFGMVNAPDGNPAYQFMLKGEGTEPPAMFTITAGEKGFEFRSDVESTRNHFRLDGTPLRNEPRIVDAPGLRLQLWSVRLNVAVLSFTVGFETFG